jgi:hypothetical protein
MTPKSRQLTYLKVAGTVGGTVQVLLGQPFGTSSELQV